MIREIKETELNLLLCQKKERKLIHIKSYMIMENLLLFPFLMEKMVLTVLMEKTEKQAEESLVFLDQ